MNGIDIVLYLDDGLRKQAKLRKLSKGFSFCAGHTFSSKFTD
jgi:hypothetical protein